MPRKSSKQALKSHLRKITTSNQNRSSTSLSNEAPKPSLSVSETLHRLRLTSPNPVKPSGTSSSLSNPFSPVVLYPLSSSLSHDTSSTVNQIAYEYLLQENIENESTRSTRGRIRGRGYVGPEEPESWKRNRRKRELKLRRGVVAKSRDEPNIPSLCCLCLSHITTHFFGSSHSIYYQSAFSCLPLELKRSILYRLPYEHTITDSRLIKFWNVSDLKCVSLCGSEVSVNGLKKVLKPIHSNDWNRKRNNQEEDIVDNWEELVDEDAVAEYSRCHSDNSSSVDTSHIHPSGPSKPQLDSLISLDLSFTTITTHPQPFISLLSDTCLSNLRVLSLSYTTSLSLSESMCLVLSISRNCGLLVVLDLSYCNWVKKQVLEVVDWERDLRRLKLLNVEGCLFGVGESEDERQARLTELKSVVDARRKDIWVVI